MARTPVWPPSRRTTRSPPGPCRAKSSQCARKAPVGCSAWFGEAHLAGRSPTHTPRLRTRPGFRRPPGEGAGHGQPHRRHGHRRALEVGRATPPELLQLRLGQGREGGWGWGPPRRFDYTPSRRARRSRRTGRAARAAVPRRVPARTRSGSLDFDRSSTQRPFAEHVILYPQARTPVRRAAQPIPHGRTARPRPQAVRPWRVTAPPPAAMGSSPGATHRGGGGPARPSSGQANRRGAACQTSRTRFPPPGLYPRLPPRWVWRAV